VKYFAISLKRLHKTSEIVRDFMK